MKKEIIGVPTTSMAPIFKNTISMFLFLNIISALIIISLIQFRTPVVIPVDDHFEQFSAERAMNYLKEFAITPHPIGSEEHTHVREYLITKLTDFGVSPEIQSFKGVVPLWGEKYTGEVNNIIARIEGKSSSNTIMISAHYDSAPNSPGAADDGAGVAAILETVRILSQYSKLENDVIILLTDGEEIGVLGAKGFVEYHPWAADVDIVLNFEARGSAGPSLIFETSEGNNELISDFIKGAPNSIAHSFTYDLYRRLPHGTDLSMFKNAGMHGLNFGFFANPHTYHSPSDNIENLSLDSLQHHGDNMLNLVSYFGNNNIIYENEGNKIYFNILGKSIISYSEKLVVPIMLFSILLFTISLINGHICKKLSFRGVSIGLLLFLITMFLTYFFGKTAWYFFNIFFSDNFAIPNTELTMSISVFSGFIALSYIGIIIIYQMAAKKVNLLNLTFGGYFGWLLLLIFSCISFKSSSYIFAWPIIFVLIGFNVLLRINNKNTLIRFAINICAAIPAILICVPVIYLLFLLFTLEEAGVLLAIAASLCVFILPIFSSLINFNYLNWREKR